MFSGLGLKPPASGLQSYSYSSLKTSPALGHPTPVLLPGKSHGQRSLVVYSPWGCKESDLTKVTQQQQQHKFYGGRVES